MLSATDVRLCNFIAEYYCCSLAEAVRSFLPQLLSRRLGQNLAIRSREKLRIHAESGNLAAQMILEKVPRRRTLAARHLETLPREPLRQLIEGEVIEMIWQVRGSRPQLENMQLKQGANLGGTKPGRVHRELFERLAAGEALNYTEARNQYGCSAQMVRRWEAEGVVVLIEKPPFVDQTVSELPCNHTLTGHQQSAVQEIAAALERRSFAPFLLFGITGSGKTEVYIESIKAALASGRTAIVIVPEIGLAQAIYYRLAAVFGDKLGLIHSRLSPSSRLDIWRHAQAGRIKIVLGPRSAVFSSLPNLGLIVVDEEHDSSLKQESPAPRYHARDVAVMRAHLENCVVVLGSATPSLESFFNVRTGKYQLLELPHRIQNRPLPEVRLLDQTASFKRRPPGFLTQEMIETMKETLANGGQVMLLLNRRGFAPSVHCYDCGERLVCRDCDIALVYHKAINLVCCHLCGFRQRYPESCPKCGKALFLFSGVGTEKLEEEVRAVFPEYGLVRMDLDSTRQTGSFAQLYRRFKAGDARILLGTQMIAKGFDFPDVALVGVVGCDNSLDFPDFRARERTFQLLTQVSGRAGRLNFAGRVLIQTLNTDEPILKLAAKQDYQHFYELESRERQELGFPPYTHLVLVAVDSDDQATGDKTATELAKLLRGARGAGLQILGPVPAPIFRRKRRYRHHILVKAKRIRVAQRLMERLVDEVQKNAPKGVNIIVDTDPADLM